MSRTSRAAEFAYFALLFIAFPSLHAQTPSPSKISGITRAALVLTHFEHGYIT